MQRIKNFKFLFVAILLIALLACGAVSVFAASDGTATAAVSTEYGEIPAEYADVNQYPFAIFNGGKFVGAASQWAAKDNAAGALPMAAPAGSTVLLRRNFTYTDDYFNNLTFVHTGVVIDLNGFTFTVVHQPMFNATKKNAQDTGITVKDGNIALSGGESVMSITSWDAEGGYAGGNKFDFVFDNVDIKLLSSATTTNIISKNTFASNAAPNVIYANVTLNNCDIDVSAATQSVTLFNMSGTYSNLGKVTAVMNGVDVIGDDTKITYVNKENAHEESSLSVATEYASIPGEYASAVQYPFAVFNGGKFVGAVSQWSAKNSGTAGAMPMAVPAGSVVLLRNNFTYSGDYYDNLSHVNTGILIDLNGFTFTVVHQPMFNAVKKTANNTGITVKNGSIVLSGGEGVIRPGAAVKGNGYSSDFTFNNVNFKLLSTAGTARIIGYNSFGTDLGDTKVSVNITLNDCNIDLSEASKSVTLFTMAGENGKITAVMNGGSITESANTVTFVDKTNANAESSFTFGKNTSGEYTTLTAPSAKAVSTESFSGLKFTKVSDNGTTATYKLMAPIVTAYGEMPATYADVDKYPFAIFNNGKFVGAASQWAAKDNAAGALPMASPAGSVILLRRNFTYTDDYFNNLSHLKTDILIDLNDHTFTVVHQPMFNATKKSNNNTEIKVKDGNIVLSGGEGVIKNSASVNGNGYYFDFTFDNVNFKLNSDATVSKIISYNAFGTDLGDTKISVNIALNDCNIDLSEAVKAITLFSMPGAVGKITATINGGSITESANSVTFVNKTNANAESSFTFGKNASGEYTTLVMPSEKAATTEKFGELMFAKVSDNGTTAAYELKAPIVTAYGEMPATYADTNAYPFVVFKNGQFFGAYSKWGGSDTPAGAIANVKEAGSVILLRRDFKYEKDYFSNLSQILSNTVIDLGSFTFTITSDPMFKAQKKTANDTKITVKNGNIAIEGGMSLIEVSSWNVNNTYAGGNKFDFIFDNVNIKYLSAATASNVITYNNFNSAAAPNAIPVSITLNGCEIDLTEASKSVTLFGMAGELGKITATVNGGKIIGSANGFTLANTDGANAGSSLTFDKNESGEFATVTLPSSVAFENVTVNGGKYVFAKKSDNGTEATYVLTPAATQGLDFVPKTSITLGSELVYNVYVPAIEVLKSYTVNGLTYEDAELVTLEDGKSYYRVAVSMPASEAAKSIVLLATVTIDGTDYTGSFTMSIPSYAKKIIEMNSSEAEVTLVKDVLAYIKAAYVYFNAADKDEAIAVIDEILGDYSSEFAKVEGNTNTAEGLKTVIIALGAKPAIRFVIPEDASLDGYTFKAGGRTLTYTTGTYTEGGVEYTYAEVELYAYQLIGEITYTAGEYSGSYHINSYYDFVTTDETYKTDANLISLVEKLYTYCKSAEAYRASVVK